MNKLLIDLENQIESLKSSKILLAIKAEFEAEGTRIDELAVLSYICTKNSVPLTLKIGGPCAKRDIYEAFQLGAKNILVPMVESKFALEFCARSYEALIPAFKPLNICPSLSINIESIKAVENIDSMLETIKNKSLPIKDIVIGRSDLAMSINEKNVNSKLIFDISSEIIRKVDKYNISATIGGNLTAESFNFIKGFDKDKLKAFESRKCTFENMEFISEKIFNEIINKGLNFELCWLNFKSSIYKNRSYEENIRINSIYKRIKK